MELNLEKRCVYCTEEEINDLTTKKPTSMAGFDYVDRDTGEVYVKKGQTLTRPYEAPKKKSAPRTVDPDRQWERERKLRERSHKLLMQLIDEYAAGFTDSAGDFDGMFDDDEAAAQGIAQDAGPAFVQGHMSRKKFYSQQDTMALCRAADIEFSMLPEIVNDRVYDAIKQGTKSKGSR